LFLAAGAVFGDEAARVVGSQTAVVVGTAISVVGIGAFLLLRLRSGRHPLGRRPLAVTALLAAQLLLLAADFQAGPAAALGVLAVVALLPAGWLLDGWLSVLALGGFVCARWVDYSLAPDSAVTTICELGAGGAAIVAARLAAGSASRARAQVARDASHDLRTPLTVLQGYLSMLEDGSIPRDQARQLATLLGGKTRELNEKIDTMLDRLQR
jgi:signal transduction histidine kinase